MITLFIHQITYKASTKACTFWFNGKSLMSLTCKRFGGFFWAYLCLGNCSFLICRSWLWLWWLLGSWSSSIIYNIIRANKSGLVLVYAILGICIVWLFALLFKLLGRREKVNHKLLTPVFLFSKTTWAGFDSNTASTLFLSY